MKRTLQTLHCGEERQVQHPYGRCIVKHTDKAELIKEMIDEEKASFQHLWYIGFGTANNQVKVIKCFESEMPDHLHFPCKEVVQYAILNGYTDFFVARTHYHQQPINELMEENVMLEARKCCKYGGLRMSDYIILQRKQHFAHRIRETYVEQWMQAAV